MLGSVSLIDTFTTSCIDNQFTDKFIVKADDDIFLNVPNMIQILRGGTIPDYDYIWKFYAQEYGITVRPHKKPEPLSSEQRNVLLLGEIATDVPPVRTITSK